MMILIEIVEVVILVGQLILMLKSHIKIEFLLKVLFQLVMIIVLLIVSLIMNVNQMKLKLLLLDNMVQMLIKNGFLYLHIHHMSLI